MCNSLCCILYSSHLYLLYPPSLFSEIGWAAREAVLCGLKSWSSWDLMILATRRSATNCTKTNRFLPYRLICLIFTTCTKSELGGAPYHGKQSAELNHLAILSVLASVVKLALTPAIKYLLAPTAFPFSIVIVHYTKWSYFVGRNMDTMSDSFVETLHRAVEAVKVVVQLHSD